jgi:hypothetical protein
MLAIGLVSLAISVTLAFPVAFPFPFPPRKVVLVVGAMTLVVHVAVALEAAARVQWLAIHSVGLLKASVRRVLVSYFHGSKYR